MRILSILWLLFLASPDGFTEAQDSLAAEAISIPENTQTLLFLTGSDRGHLHPRGCLKGAGGAVYRAEFNRGLSLSHPQIDRLWVGVGDVLAGGFEEGASPPGTFLDHLVTSGYHLLGVGLRELDALGASKLHQLAKQAQVSLVCSNVIVHETGKPLWNRSLTVETQAGTIAFISLLPHDPAKVWGDPKLGTVITISPEAALEAALAEIGDEVDSIVLLTTLSQVKLGRLLKNHPRIDMVAASVGNLFRSDLDLTGPVPTLYLGMWGQVLGVVAMGEKGMRLDARTHLVTPDFPGMPDALSHRESSPGGR